MHREVNYNLLLNFVFLFIIVILCGSLTGLSSDSSRRIEEMEKRIADDEVSLRLQAEANRKIAENLSAAELLLEESGREIADIKSENEELVARNKRSTQLLESLQQGIGEDQEVLSGVISRIDYYIEATSTD